MKSLLPQRHLNILVLKGQNDVAPNHISCPDKDLDAILIKRSLHDYMHPGQRIGAVRLVELNHGYKMPSLALVT